MVEMVVEEEEVEEQEEEEEMVEDVAQDVGVAEGKEFVQYACTTIIIIAIHMDTISTKTTTVILATTP